MARKITILFLAANPKDTTKLRLDEEIREIQSKIRAAEFRDWFELISRWAVRPGDLIQAFNEVQSTSFISADTAPNMRNWSLRTRTEAPSQ